MWKSSWIPSIRADLANDEPRLVVADWLQERGDPRGEFIHAQIALNKLALNDQRRGYLTQRIHQLLAENQEQWVANLPGCDWQFHRGFIVQCRVDMGELAGSPEELFLKIPTLVHVDVTDERARISEHPAILERWLDLADVHQILSLDFRYCSLGLPGAKVLSRAKNLSNIQCLNLYHTHLDAEAMGALVRGEHWHSIRELGLSDNPFGAEGVRIWARKFPCTNLQKVTLAYNNLDNAGISALCEGKYPHLLRIELAANSITDGAACLLAEKLDTPAIRELDLAHNRLETEGIKALIQSKQLSRVRYLGLQANHLTAEHLFGLISDPHIERIRSLDLRSNPVSDAGAEMLARCSLLEKLESLNLRATRLGDVGVSEIAQSEHFRNLRELWLNENLFSAMAVEQLRLSPHLQQCRIELTQLGNLRSDRVQPPAAGLPFSEEPGTE
jgi:uncharacterized protein (TIGR02996 family)